MTIKWTVSQLDRNTADGFVTTAHWQCTATDGEYSASVYASCGFDGELSVAYDSLTEEVVLAWVWESVDKEATEAAVLAQIEAQKNPVSATGLPW
jgi:aspartate oxidase